MGRALARIAAVRDSEHREAAVSVEQLLGDCEGDNSAGPADRDTAGSGEAPVVDDGFHLEARRLAKSDDLNGIALVEVEVVGGTLVNIGFASSQVGDGHLPA